MPPTMMARQRDLGALYADNMLHFGCGTAMYHPVAAADMVPPCIGYLDKSRRWNHLTNIEWAGDDRPDTRTYMPLEKTPQKMAQLNIEWRPRTTLGVRQHIVDAKGDSPNVGLPVGAGTAIRYVSKTKFGAVMIAAKPITLTTYNDETLFRHWLTTNRAKLAELHGRELSRYGLWLVTRTYTAPKVSINAWLDRDKDASMTLKVKANMMGDIAGDVDWEDKASDKDWSHFSGDGGVVAFFDGIEIPAWQWWYDGTRARIGQIGDSLLGREKAPMPNRRGLLPHGTWRPSQRVDPRRQSAPGVDDMYTYQSPLTSRVPDRLAPGVDDNTLMVKQIALDSPTKQIPDDDTNPATADIWGSYTPPPQSHSPSPTSSRRGRPASTVIRHDSSRHASTPARLPSNNATFTGPFSTPSYILRLSTASTVAGNGTNENNDSNDISSQRSQRQELRRKISSPSLRGYGPRVLQT